MELEGFDQLVVYVGSICVFLLLGALVGTRLEREHYRRIREREARTRDFRVVTLQTLPQDWSVEACCLVTGSVVISLDYFKRFLARLRMLVGGRLRSYEPLLDRRAPGSAVALEGGSRLARLPCRMRRTIGDLAAGQCQWERHGRR